MPWTIQRLKFALPVLRWADPKCFFEALGEGTLGCKSPRLRNLLYGPIRIPIDLVASFLKAQSKLILTYCLSHAVQKGILQRTNTDPAQARQEFRRASSRWVRMDIINRSTDLSWSNDGHRRLKFLRVVVRIV